jgi:hypothetical protein
MAPPQADPAAEQGSAIFEHSDSVSHGQQNMQMGPEKAGRDLLLPQQPSPIFPIKW